MTEYDIQKVKDASDIVAVVSRYVQLRKTGRNYVGLCPFHEERTPSFNVNADRSSFKCFGCGQGGDVIAFIMEHNKLPFPDAVRFLADQTNISLDATGGVLSYPVKAPKPQTQTAPLYTTDQVYSYLFDFQDAFAGSEAERYVNSRGISSATARKYKLGYAARGKWPHFGEGGKPVMQAQNGRVVFLGYGPGLTPANLYGRAIFETDFERDKKLLHAHLPMPKGWFNGAAAYQHLPGDGPLFICEGTFDALSLIEAGYPCTVAIYGIQSGMRWDWISNVREVVFAFDQDASGQKKQRELSIQAMLAGKRVRFLDSSSYGGHKDLNSAWVNGCLKVRE